MNTWDLVKDEASAQALREITAQKNVSLEWKPFTAIREAMPNLPKRTTQHIQCDGAEVVIGEDLDPQDADRLAIEGAARAIMPWKKGPFRLFGIPIDAEWRSDFKWDRLAPKLSSQEDKVVLDVGCNNGYYLFRILPQKPKFLLGIDPVPRLHYQYHLLQHYAQIPNMDFQMWGWAEVAHFEEAFDTIFCMGILYHHPDPIGMLRVLHKALKPGGLLVMESIIIPGDSHQCLFPEERYARMRNVWFVPTLEAMNHMLRRTKFIDLETVATNIHEPAEQRTTPWNPGPSYEAFLDPDDASLTVEGYPAPHRAIVLAKRKP